MTKTSKETRREIDFETSFRDGQVFLKRQVWMVPVSKRGVERLQAELLEEEEWLVGNKTNAVTLLQDLQDTLIFYSEEKS